MRPINIYLITARQMELTDVEDVQDDWEDWLIDAIDAIDLDELDTLEEVHDLADGDDDVFASSEEFDADYGSSDSDQASSVAAEQQQVVYNTDPVGVMTSTSESTESIYRIRTSGRIEVLQKPTEQELWRFYLSALQCDSFTVVRQHRVEVAGTRTDFTLLLLGDEEAILRGSAVNLDVTNVLAETGYGEFFGDALVVCLHAVGEDGDDTNLADVGLIYEAIGRCLPTPWTAEQTAAVRAAPLEGRVLELLGLFNLE
jgi:hypothetical protein